jgi:homoserine O-succinyltransferase
MDWGKTHVHSKFYICWGAQAALYHNYGIEKLPLDEKMFGLFSHKVNNKLSMWTRGFDDCFMAPHSRHTSVDPEAIRKINDLEIIAESDEAGVYLIKSRDSREFYVMGHSEYDPYTLKKEYDRDVNLGRTIKIPQNYFVNDDPKNEVLVTWRSHANLLFSNWLNYYVYQSTPFDINAID